MVDTVMFSAIKDAKKGLADLFDDSASTLRELNVFVIPGEYGRKAENGRKAETDCKADTIRDSVSDTRLKPVARLKLQGIQFLTARLSTLGLLLCGSSC